MSVTRRQGGFGFRLGNGLSPEGGTVGGKVLNALYMYIRAADFDFFENEPCCLIWVSLCLQPHVSIAIVIREVPLLFTGSGSTPGI